MSALNSLRPIEWQENGARLRIIQNARKGWGRLSLS